MHKCFTVLVWKKVQIKNTVRYYFKFNKLVQLKDVDHSGY